MNYTELCTAIESVVENDFTAVQLARFVEQAEQKIYNLVQIPALRKNQTSTLTLGNKYLTVPEDWLYTYSLVVVGSDSRHSYLLEKDVNFIREAYPLAATVGLPKHYAVFDKDTFILGPAPDAYYAVELHYGYYPESIVTATTTWLGDNFDSVLLNGALTEAAKELKSDPDMVALYDKQFAESMMALKMLSDGKLRQDAYRAGQVRVPVK